MCMSMNVVCGRIERAIPKIGLEGKGKGVFREGEGRRGEKTGRGRQEGKGITESHEQDDPSC